MTLLFQQTSYPESGYPLYFNPSGFDH